MSEEEKNAIEYFNDETKSEAMYYGTILLNLIEKQQKEIEELKQKLIDEEEFNKIIKNTKLDELFTTLRRNGKNN